MLPKNKQVVFRTDSGIWHGVSTVHSDVPRISLALYYYKRRSMLSILKTVVIGRMTVFESDRVIVRSLHPYIIHKYYLIRTLLSKLAHATAHTIRYNADTEK